MKHLIVVFLVALTSACVSPYEKVPYQPSWDTSLVCPDITFTPPDVNINVDIPKNLCGSLVLSAPQPAPVAPVKQHVVCDIRNITKLRLQHSKVVSYIAKPDITQEEVLRYGLAWINTSSSIIGKLEVEYAKCLRN